jgi:hypothetical protein
MKKVYLMLGAAFAAFTVNAQNISNENAKVPKTKHEQVASEVNITPKPQPNNVNKVTLWSNTFSSAADWVFTAQSPDNYGGWVITTSTAAMPNAAADLFPFASTTIANGYALIDSDGSPFTSDGGGEVAGQIRIATPIDLTGEPFVMLRYQNNYRWWQDTRGVRVSGDNGVTWTDYVLTDNDGYPNDQNSENPDIVQINISAVAGGQSQVLVEFFYTDNNFWGWYWAIDDVEIVRLPENELQVEKVWPGDIVADFDYSRIPTGQAAAMTVGAAIANLGYTAQNNTPVNLVIQRNGTEVYTQTVNFDFSVDPLNFEIDTVWFNTTYVPTELGVYTCIVSVPADDNNTNNTASQTMETTQWIYGHDYTGGVYRFDRDEETATGIQFIMEATQTISSVDVVFAPATTEQSVIVEVWDASSGSVQSMDPILATFTTYNIQPADIAGNVVTTIELASPAVLQAGGTYCIQVRKEVGPGRVFYAGSAIGDDDNGTVCYGPFGEGQAVNFFVSWGFSPSIRANFDPSVSIENNKLVSVANVYPNPASDFVMIPLEDGQAATATLVDLSGKEISSSSVSGLTNFSLEGVANGVYFLNIATAEGVSTQKVVVRK